MLRPTVSALAFALVPCVAASDTQAQDTFTLVELAPNVHIALVTPNPPRYVFANALVVIRERDVLVVDVTRRWWLDASPDRRRLVRHALRTLVKAGDAGALAVLGYGAETPNKIRAVTCKPDVIEIGEKVRIEVNLANPSDEDARALVDLRIHFVKANGSTSPKVFKGAEVTLKAGGTATVRKSVSLAQHTTRKHYPGSHRVEVMLNGVVHPGADFEIV